MRKKTPKVWTHKSAEKFFNEKILPITPGHKRQQAWRVFLQSLAELGALE